jgi:hypothetical protein
MNTLIRKILLTLIIFIIGCEDNRYEYDDIDLVYNINLPIDENGYYHMELGEAWQSLKRITANLKTEHFPLRP